MPDTKLQALVVILTETRGTGPDAVTQRVELRGYEAVKAAAQIRANLLSPPPAPTVGEKVRDWVDRLQSEVERDAAAAEEAAPVAEPVEEPPPPAPIDSLDVFQAMAGGTPREVMAAQRRQTLWNEAHPVMPSHLCRNQQRQWCKDHGVDPPCGPSRKGIVSQFLDIFGS